jgi:hypothetical protein
MNIDKTLEEFRESKFTQFGGLCFECCDFEELWSEVQQEIIKAIITEYKSLREELEDLKEHNLDKEWELCYESQINSLKQKMIKLEKKLK